MAEIASPLDEYTLRARLAPSLVVVVIPVMGLLCWLPTFSTTQLTLTAALTTVLMVLFSQFGRDQGRLLQPVLYTSWGGQPSVQLLRFRSNLLAKETRERYRRQLESLNPSIRLPTELEEMADAAEADRVYDSVCLFLREATRNKATFPLVFAENVNYGFRRNLLAMKPAGMALCLAGTISSLLVTVMGIKTGSLEPPPIPFVVAILNAVMLTWWCLRINSEWVRVAAFAYAERLLGACDSMPRAMSPPKSVATEFSKE
ncbi:hypothetical protein GC163_24615 [bacterium]|nr:hypothetical protein [bacterium]